MYKHYSFSSPKKYASMQLPDKFPEDIECIIRSSDSSCGSLYISNIQAAQNPQTLKRLKIQSILTCAKGHELSHSKNLIPYYKYIATVDHDSCDLTGHFEEAVDFIVSSLKNTNILVHCLAGVSRSVSMVIAYFIRQHKMTYNAAYQQIKSKRKIINPNDGFISQLKKYHQKQNFQEKSTGKSTEKSTLTSERYKYQKPQENIYRSKYSYTMKQIPTNDFKKDLTPKKISQQFNSRDEKDFSYYGRTATSESFKRPERNIQSMKNYEQFSKSMTFNTKQSPQTIRYENQESPNYKTSLYQHRSSKGAKYEDMTKELNEKINKIRSKYQEERKKIYEKYERYSPIKEKGLGFERKISPQIPNLYYGRQTDITTPERIETKYDNLIDKYNTTERYYGKGLLGKKYNDLGSDRFRGIDRYSYKMGMYSNQFY